MNVLITIPLAGKDGQARLAGVLQYLTPRHPWNVSLPSSHQGFPLEQLEAEMRRGVDGVITSETFDPDTAQLLARARVPVIALHDSYMHRKEFGDRLRLAITDHVAIGRLAARHFLSLGHFATYAYLGDTERNRWGRARGLGFDRELRRIQAVPSSFMPSHDSSRRLDFTRFSHWLADLPRPVALFAANDRLAVQAVECCHALKLAVPRDVAICGVDNDEALIASTTPSLTTIEPDFTSAGFAAARMLDQLLTGANGKVPKIQLFKPRRLIERASTRPLSPAVKLVERALAYINANPDRHLSVEDVAVKLGVSRPLLDLRFRELGRGTVADAIRVRRLEEVKRLLRETDFTIRQIGRLTGFASETSLKNIFHRAFGCSMSTFRTRGN